MTYYRCPLEPGQYYHIYNRGNNSQQIFFSEANYNFFKSRFEGIVSPYLDILAWCLMPNHFHFVVRVKEVLNSVEGVKNIESADVSNAFQRLFTGYSKAINKLKGTHGSIFEKPFQRIQITSDSYLRSLIIYVHNNPVHHGYKDAPNDWKHSSYNAVLNQDFSYLINNETLDLFDDKKNFVFCHKARIELEAALAIE
ncbi:MAG: transposase [Bacteroidota bacterium]